MLKSNLVQLCELSMKAKTLLQKPSHLRTQSELDYLKQFTLRLKCFWSYSYSIRYQLIHALYYQSLNKGSIVHTDQGGLIYMISGSVRIVKKSHKGVDIVVGHIGPGCELTRDNKTSLICKTDIELLYVRKTDLESILKTDCDVALELKINLICEHHLFSEWTKITIAAIAESSSFVKYSPNSIIVKDLSKLSDYIYLVVQGSCHVVQKLKMRELQDYQQKRTHFIMPLSPDNYKGMVVRKWVSLYALNPGDVFGMGEGNTGTCVLSKHHIKCLAINRHVLLKHDRYGRIAILRDDITRVFPSVNTIFEKFIEWCQWNEYKKDIYTTIMSKEEASFKLPPIIKTTGKYLDSSVKK